MLLEREKQRGHRVGSQYLGMLLHDHESLRVAVLNACEGARTSKRDPFAGSAQTLVQQGIPAVIAMQFEIADDVASTFAHEFYGALADGYPIDAAVTEARKAIFATGREVEWATPVLYLRAPDGRIFDIDRPAVNVDRRAAGADHRPAAGPSALVSLAGELDLPVQAASPPEPAAMTTEERFLMLLRSAGQALATGDFAIALEQLQQVRAVDPSAPGARRFDVEGGRAARRGRDPGAAPRRVPRASRRRGGAVDQARTSRPHLHEWPKRCG